jgi:hypothetical protein
MRDPNAEVARFEAVGVVEKRASFGTLARLPRPFAAHLDTRCWIKEHLVLTFVFP